MTTPPNPPLRPDTGVADVTAYDRHMTAEDALVHDTLCALQAPTGLVRLTEMMARGEDFSEFCWSFTQGKVIKNDGKSFAATTPLSEQISKELKRRGFKFVGPTIVYAWMQAVGIANDHASRCFRRNEVAR